MRCLALLIPPCRPPSLCGMQWALPRGVFEPDYLKQPSKWLWKVWFGRAFVAAGYAWQPRLEVTRRNPLNARLGAQLWRANVPPPGTTAVFWLQLRVAASSAEPLDDWVAGE